LYSLLLPNANNQIWVCNFFDQKIIIYSILGNEWFKTISIGLRYLPANTCKIYNFVGNRVGEELHKLDNYPHQWIKTIFIDG